MAYSVFHFLLILSSQLDYTSLICLDFIYLTWFIMFYELQPSRGWAVWLPQTLFSPYSSITQLLLLLLTCFKEYIYKKQLNVLPQTAHMSRMLCFVILFDYCWLYANILIALISNVLIFVCLDFHVSIYTVTGTFFFSYPWGHHLVMHRLYLSLGVKGAKLMKDIGLQLTT